MKKLLLSIGLVWTLSTQISHAAPKTKEAIEALGTIIAVEHMATTACPEITINQEAHSKYLEDINPAKAPTVGPKDNKAVDAVVERHIKELEADIQKAGLKEWCKSVLEMFGGKGFPYPVLELKPTTEVTPTLEMKK
jgi:hypothetical protein